MCAGQLSESDEGADTNTLVSMAFALFRIVAAMTAPCSVKTQGM